MLRAYKYQLNLNDTQKHFLAQAFGHARFIYNWGLGLKKEAWEKEKKSLSYNTLAKMLTDLKKDPEHLWLNDVSHECLQQSLRNMFSAYNNFFKLKKGFPIFKSKYEKQSIKNINNTHIDFENSKLKIPIIGWLKFHKNRDFTGKVKSITISKNTCGKYFASVLVETGINQPKKAEVKRESAIGIDMGLKDFAVFSNGEKKDNPRFYKILEQRKKYAQRKLSKKKKGSNRYNLQKLKVAKIHYKISCQHENFMHQLSSQIVRENQTVIVEDLAVKNMMRKIKPKQDENGKYLPNGQARKRGLNKSIAGASWAEFIKMLEYKCAWSGKNFIKIGRYEASTKTCSCCGTVNYLLTLKDREWACANCGTTHDRDVNGAVNVKEFGLEQYFSGKVNSRRGREGSRLRHRRNVKSIGYQ